MAKPPWSTSFSTPRWFADHPDALGQTPQKPKKRSGEIRGSAPKGHQIHSDPREQRRARTWVILQSSTLDRAPEARQVFSLGREPQEPGAEKTFSRGAATDFLQMMAAAHPAARICRPSGARRKYWIPKPGAHAPGYSSFAAPRLGIASWLTGSIRRFSERDFLRCTTAQVRHMPHSKTPSNELHI